ncbi:MAG: cell division control protein Cdc6, partial [Nanoarchaeota archaeon]
FAAVEASGMNNIIILDEIDQLVKKAGDEVIYNLTRINADLKSSKITLIGISNDLMFANDLDPRVKSSLSEEELVFPPYNALQIRDILERRAQLAFRPDALGEGVLQKCAAYAARDHGDARRALELLRVAGELAERQGETILRIQHIDEAEDKIDKDRIIEIVRTQPKQFQAVLYSILLIKKKKEGVFTGEVYDLYKNICDQTGLRPLTQRRVSDVIAEFDMLGIINANVISKGRFGRTREIHMELPANLEQQIKKLIAADLDLAEQP